MGRKGKAAKERKRDERRAQERDRRWIEVNYQEWDEARAGAKRAAPQERLSAALSWNELQTKVISFIKATKVRAEGTGASSSGLERPDAAVVVHTAAEGEEEAERDLTLEEGIAVWKVLCNKVFPKLASFEPLQYVSVVAGRPVVVPMGCTHFPSLSSQAVKILCHIYAAALTCGFVFLRPRPRPFASPLTRSCIGFLCLFSIPPFHLRVVCVLLYEPKQWGVHSFLPPQF